MKMEIPMPPLKMSAHIDAVMKVDGPGGLDGSIRITGPRDDDKDGDPEFTIHLDFPGKAFDKTFDNIEIPLASALTMGVPALIDMALSLIPAFPLKGLIVMTVKEVLENIPKMLGTNERD